MDWEKIKSKESKLPPEQPEVKKYQAPHPMDPNLSMDEINQSEVAVTFVVSASDGY